MRDVACAGYVAGCNTTFFAEVADKANPTDPDYALAAAAQNIMARLSFADSAGASYGSMLAFPANAKQFRSGHLDTAMSVTTRLLPWEVTSGNAGGMHNSFPGGEKIFELYMAKLNLRQIHFGEDSAPPRTIEHCGACAAAPPSRHPRLLRFARAQ